MTKECFGEQCKDCGQFFCCEDHFPIGCWGDCWSEDDGQ